VNLSHFVVNFLYLWLICLQPRWICRNLWWICLLLRWTCRILWWIFHTCGEFVHNWDKLFTFLGEYVGFPLKYIFILMYKKLTPKSMVSSSHSNNQILNTLVINPTIIQLQSIKFELINQQSQFSINFSIFSFTASIESTSSWVSAFAYLDVLRMSLISLF